MSNDRDNPGRTEELVSYLVDRLSGRVGRTMLLKLLYLADLEARRYTGRPLSTLDYMFHLRGPFDPEIYRAIDALRDAGEIAEDVDHYPTATAYRYTSLNPGRAHRLSHVDEAILTYVLRTYSSRGLQEVLEVVYETRPMKLASEAGRGTRIPMEVVDGEGRDRLGGIDLERALLAEDNVRRGRTVPWSDLRRELLDRSRRTGS